MKAALEKLKELYEAHGTIYRLYWTLLPVGAAAIISLLAEDPVWFPIATLVGTIITSEARKRTGLADPR